MYYVKEVVVEVFVFVERRYFEIGCGFNRGIDVQNVKDISFISNLLLLFTLICVFKFSFF